nr:CMGC/CDK/CRK7 protein kinase [Kwoniella dejecticola CBS 10117]OBR82879.1 CMGC/CDK/CRK7 protein kinase [Kwoniella dejecticola CBS 10117]
MSDRYSISRALSPPMPSYEPLSASSSSSTQTQRQNHMPVKRESWRPGQPSTSASAGPSSAVTNTSSNSATPTNAWTDPTAGPSESHLHSHSHNPPSTGNGRDGSRSPSIRSRRDGSPASSRGYDRDRDRDRDRGRGEEVGMDDGDSRRDFDRRRDRDFDRGKRRNFVTGRNGGIAHEQSQGQGQERSWAAWNQKVQSTSRPDDRDDRGWDRRRDFDRNRNNRDVRDRDRDRGKDDDRNHRRLGNSDNNDDQGINGDRSWAAWKAKVHKKDRGSTQNDRSDVNLENAKKEGFWTGASRNRNNFDRNERGNGPRRNAQRDSPDYGPASSDRGRRASPDYGDQPRRDRTARRDSPDYGERTARGARDSPDYGVGGRDSGRSRPTSPQANERKRAPSSPRQNDPKRQRDLSPDSHRDRDSPSPSPVNRWARPDHRSPEPSSSSTAAPASASRVQRDDRERSPPPPPRVRPASPPSGRRAPLAPQGETFITGGNTRPWGRRSDQPPQRNFEREDGSQRPYDGSRPPGFQDPPHKERNRYEDRSIHPQRDYQHAPPQSSYAAKLPPPNNEALPYASPPAPSVSSMSQPSPALDANPFDPYSQRNDSGAYPPQPAGTISTDSLVPPIQAQPEALATGSIKISFNASPKKGWKSISPSKTIQNLFEGPGSPPQNGSQPPSQAHQYSPTKSTVSLDRRSSTDTSAQQPQTVAPYIQAAFTSWYDQNMQPPIENFLVHYFGREPSAFELGQVEILLRRKQGVAPTHADSRDIDNRPRRDEDRFESRERQDLEDRDRNFRYDRHIERNFERDRDRNGNGRFGRNDEMHSGPGIGNGNGGRFDSEIRHFRDRDRRFSNSNSNSNNIPSNGPGGVNDIPVIQSRWTPQKSTTSNEHQAQTHGPPAVGRIPFDVHGHATPYPTAQNGSSSHQSRFPPEASGLPGSMQSAQSVQLPTSDQLKLIQTQLAQSQTQPQSQPQTQTQINHSHVQQIPTPASQPDQPPAESITATGSTTASTAAPTSTSTFQPTTSGEMYTLLSHVGEGTYGKVYKALNTDTGNLVALKKIRLEGEKDGFPVTAMREIKLLQDLKHVNVVRLLEIMVSKGNVHMVFEYMEHDLTGLLSHPTLKFSPGNIKSLSYQMLDGLSYLHRKNILHRDLKGSNILLNSKGELKLADFGLARLYSAKANHRKDDYTNRVITLWYRSPELLMGETRYKSEVDMWSAGCIILEIFLTKPIFQGTDEINQLEVIYNIMGTPKESEWPGVKDLPWYELVKPKETIESKFIASFEKWLSPAALELVQGLLRFDPSQRLSAVQAMKADYFVLEQPPMEMPAQ